MSQILIKAGPLTPVTDVIDLIDFFANYTPPFDLKNDVPAFIGLEYWVSTVGGSGAGGFDMAIVATDPSGTDAVLSGNVLDLQNPDAKGVIPVQIIDRLSTTSKFEINTTITGAADGAEISYRLLMTDPDGSGSYLFNV